MSKTKHTPGPYVSDSGDSYPPPPPDWSVIGTTDEDGFSAIVAYCHPTNVPLLKSAPHLLATLESIVKDAELAMGDETGHNDLLTLELIANKAREAIAKAVLESRGGALQNTKETNQ